MEQEQVFGLWTSVSYHVFEKAKRHPDSSPAREHPEAQVTGSDIVIPQPTNVPSNCHFIVKDAEEEWDYPHPFEFIHARAVISIFKDPRHFIASAFKALTPGGFLELMDAIYPFGYEDPQPPPNSPLPRWVDLSMKSAVAAGRPWTNTQYYETWMKEAGFINVRSEKAWIAIGAWVEGEDEEAAKKRRLGRMMEENVLSAIDAMAPRMLERLGWKMEDNREFVEAVKEQLTSGKVKSGGWVLTVWGERPAE